MNRFLAWLKIIFYKQISTNPVYLDKTVNRILLPLIFIIPLIILYLNFPGNPEIPFSSRATYTSINEPISPIPKNLFIDKDKAEIGEILFYSNLLSRDEKFSCNTCHTLETGGTIRNYSENSLNPATVFNAGIFFRNLNVSQENYFNSIHINELIHFPSDMGEINMNLNNLKKDNNLLNKIKLKYGSSPNIEIINDSLLEFIISLYTPNSKFDKYLRGEKNSLSLEEKEGYSLFKELGCISCHQGVNLGGNLYQTVGITDDYFKDKDGVGDLDLGLYLKTKKEEDKYKFKVPSLRNIAVTYPYLHDGRYKSLKEVVFMMSKYQLGKQLSEADTEKIVYFLHTLTGEYKGQLLK
jgi:cytochrome c peroxidase